MDKKQYAPTFEVVNRDVEFAIKVLRRKLSNGGIFSLLKRRGDNPSRAARLKAKRVMAAKKYELKKKEKLKSHYVMTI